MNYQINSSLHVEQNCYSNQITNHLCYFSILFFVLYLIEISDLNERFNRKSLIYCFRSNRVLMLSSGLRPLEPHFKFPPKVEIKCHYSIDCIVKISKRRKERFLKKISIRKDVEFIIFLLNMFFSFVLPLLPKTTTVTSSFKKKGLPYKQISTFFFETKSLIFSFLKDRFFVLKMKP